MITTPADGESLVRQFLGGRGERVADIDHRVLDRTTPDHMVVEYQATIGCGNQLSKLPVIAKYYGERDGRVAFNALRQLRARLPADGVLRVPEAYFYDAALGILAQERVRGIPCVALLEGGRDIDAELLGVALTCLHSLGGGECPPKTLGEHVDELVRPHPLVLADACPEYRLLIEEALISMHRLASRADFRYEATPIHRDFQLRQLFVEGDRVWVVDWDTFAVGDPAFDVAYFLVYLDTHFEPRLSARLRDRFIAGYLRSRPASVLDRLPVYEVFNYLRRACRRFRIRDRGWESEMRRMMRRLEDRLCYVAG